MTEDLLHFIWNYKLFNLQNLKTVDNHEFEIVSIGTHNHDSGPDFFNSQIKIDDVVWVGQVEIHINASDWNLHKHHLDPAYDNTILHVVYNYDKEGLTSKRSVLPVLELKGRITQRLLNINEQLVLSKHKIVCQGLLRNLDEFKTATWLNRLLIQRLERKVLEIQQIHESNKGDWSQTTFVMLAKNLGFNVNKLPMQILAEQIDFKILLKLKDKLTVIESILFGVSGLLDNSFTENYPKTLCREFTHQKVKHNFTVLDSKIWKFGRIRPSNFPTLRLAQLAQIIHQSGDLFAFLIRDFEKSKVLKILQLSASKYWESHYTFKSSSEQSVKRLGSDAVNLILINTVAPLLFFYGQEIGALKYQELAIELLESLPPENNSITKKWTENNINSKNAADSQSLIEQINVYCKPKKCLSCGIGMQILKG